MKYDLSSLLSGGFFVQLESNKMFPPCFPKTFSGADTYTVYGKSIKNGNCSTLFSEA